MSAAETSMVIGSAGVVHHPPMSALGCALAPIDRRLGRLTTCGAAFIALGAISAVKPRKE